MELVSFFGFMEGMLEVGFDGVTINKRCHLTLVTVNKVLLTMF